MSDHIIESLIDLTRHFESRYTDNTKLLKENKPISFEWEKSAAKFTHVVQLALRLQSISTGAVGAGLSFTAVVLWHKGYRLLLTVPLLGAGIYSFTFVIPLWKLSSNFSKLNSLINRALLAYVCESAETTLEALPSKKEIEDLTFSSLQHSASWTPTALLCAHLGEKALSIAKFVKFYFFSRIYKNAACQHLWEKMHVMANSESDSLKDDALKEFYRTLGKACAQRSLQKYKNVLSEEIKDVLLQTDETDELVFQILGYQYLCASDKEKVLALEGWTTDSFKDNAVIQSLIHSKPTTDLLKAGKSLLDAAKEG